MAEVEEPQFNTLKERIEALNRQKNFKAPPPKAGKRAPPPPPPNRAATTIGISDQGQTVSSDSISAQKSPLIPPRPVRSVTEKGPPPLPRRKTGQENDTENDNGPRQLEPPPPLPGTPSSQPPPLPSRSSSQQQVQQFSPALPSRRPSAQTLPVRRNSNSSDISYISTVSSLSLNQTRSYGSNAPQDNQPVRRLPPPLEQAKLPPLPPSRRELEAKAREEKEAAARSPSLPPKSASGTPRVTDPPTLPPRLPSRPGRSPRVPQNEAPSPALPTRRLPPPANFLPKENGFSRPAGGGVALTPPVVPVSSRPTFEQIDAVASRAASAPPTPAGRDCLICRDFSAPDAIAAQHPIHSLPRQDPVGYLAYHLCSPFPSHTDKARAIFTWCHHNIAYDVEGFFGRCIPRGQTPAEMIFSGKAVCEGYARVFEAVAQRAGLEVIVICGHGKGYGFTPVEPGRPPPPKKPTGHAWNAVRIDGDEWKIIDACWGAGALSDKKYNKRFAPEMFCLSNELIGLKHFPEDPKYFFRSDGRVPTWEEYIIGPANGAEMATWYSGGTDEGLSEFTFTPREKKISIYSGQVVRFQFSKICEHWLPEKHGKGKQMLFAIKIHGLDGRKDDLVCMDHNGIWFWCDIPARDLGAPGQSISLLGFDTLDGQSARGVSKAEFERKKGRCGYSMVGIAAWDLV
ncbi:hypothetical protein B0H63DRAFT_118755 [Podospora didyma]|uniref:Transglutaminase-like domain-containing protein n=1 Tax=Podospora didyma TaxID=330526 RepID=A0AAE0P009_9PEZI|nr:hypothetical protein B0H63DRAFT_118755 [Podospora didyma]